jgi:hypothetical protein
MEWLLDIALVLLLTLTLFHAMRLERALGVLQRDRAALEELIGRFNSSTRQAEQGVDQLRTAAEGAGRQIARQVETATALKDDLVFLIERGERVAERLDGMVRAARPLLPGAGRQDSVPRIRPRLDTSLEIPSHAGRPTPPADSVAPRARSQAERDLLNALRAVR